MVNAHEPDAVYVVGHAEHIVTSLELLEGATPSSAPVPLRLHRLDA